MARARGSYRHQGGLKARKRNTTAVRTHASLTTALAGDDNDLVWRAVESGVGGNSLTITYVVAGVSTPLTIVKAGNAITVNVATNGASAATSTANQIKDLANTLGTIDQFVEAEVAAGNDGTGVVTALGATPLAGGA